MSCGKILVFFVVDPGRPSRVSVAQRRRSCFREDSRHMVLGGSLPRRNELPEASAILRLSEKRSRNRSFFWCRFRYQKHSDNNLLRHVPLRNGGLIKWYLFLTPFLGSPYWTLSSEGSAHVCLDDCVATSCFSSSPRIGERQST